MFFSDLIIINNLLQVCTSANVSRLTTGVLVIKRVKRLTDTDDMIFLDRFYFLALCPNAHRLFVNRLF